MYCRCSYSWLRMSCITRNPTWFARYVCPIPMMAVTIGIAIMNPTYWYRVLRSGHGPPPHVPGGLPNSALSKTALISNGFTTPSPDVTTIARPTSATLRRYGANVAITRRMVCVPMGRGSFSTPRRRKRP
jgi:hypothetical protein